MVAIAYINNFWVFVEEENVTRGIEISNHPVEEGMDITDNIKRQPITLSLSGEIVDNNGKSAPTILSNIQSLHQSGKYVKYSGRNIIKNAIIETFDTGHPNEVTGGCTFSMTLKEIRVAKPAYVKQTTEAPTSPITKQSTKSGTQQVQKNTDATYYTVKRGDTLWNIAVAFYGSGSQASKILEANKDIISKSNVTSPGQVLLIP